MTTNPQQQHIPASHQTVEIGSKAHSELLKGASILAEAVKSTMGPSGHSVIIDMDVGSPLITKDGVTVAKSINLKNRLQSMGAELIKEVASKTNEMAGDGPQPTYAKVLTPLGWTTMGALKVGDIICGTNGTYQTVLGVYQKGLKDIYKVTLADGNKNTRLVECSEEHLWSVQTNYGSQQTLTVKQMLDNGINRKGSNVGGKYFVKPTVVTFEDTILPIDPYLLGVLIGDGSLSKTGDIEIAVGLAEENILDNLILPEGCKLRKQYYVDKKHYIRATITGSDRLGKSRYESKSILKKMLNDLNLLGTCSHTKFIPKKYLFSSIQNRQRLLDGIIDTDGYINKRGLFEISTVSEQLCSDIIELSRSLGKSVCYKKYERKQGDGSYGSSSIFRITELKGNKYGLKIKKIEKQNKQVEMMCIKVSNDDHLYITDDYVATHNTTTATVLAYNMLHFGTKAIATGCSSIDLKKGMDLGTATVLEFLKESAIPVKDNNDIINVGTISANGDRELGTLIAQAIEKVGQDGIITVEPAKSISTTLTTVEGLQLDSGYLSPFFVTNSEKANCEFENPIIAITANKITNLQDIIPLMEQSMNSKRPLVIIADDVEGEALHALIVNKMKNVLKVCAIKAPSYGEHRSDLLADLATVTGTDVIGATTETKIEKMKIDKLGSCSKVIINRTNTVFVGNNNTSEKTKERINTLRTLLMTDTTLDEGRQARYKQRLAKLSGGVAIIKVGGSTEVEIREKKDRVDDAVNATVAATQEGIVPGGGTILFYASQYLKEYLKLDVIKEQFNDDIITGIKIIADACEMPFKTIISNTGKSSDVFANEMQTRFMNGPNGTRAYMDEKKKLHKWTMPNEFGLAYFNEDKSKLKFGFDASTGKYVDLIETGVIDPIKVTRLSLEHASSVIGLILTCNAVIINEEAE